MEKYQRVLAYEIQTTNRCNGRCLICPHSEINQTSMDMGKELFQKIINEISMMDRTIRIIPYLNNEPFLDPFFVERLFYIREKCPTCTLEISTNLSCLRPDILRALIDCRVDDLRISCFGFRKESYERVMRGLSFSVFRKQLAILLEAFEQAGIKQRVSLTMIEYPGFCYEDYNKAQLFCQKHEISLNLWGFLDRAGNVHTYSNDIVITEEDERQKRYICAQNRHWERMHIYVDGTVVLCCQDWQSEYPVGNVGMETLAQIWSGDPIQKLRRQMEERGISYPDICKKCKILMEGVR